MEGPPKMLIKLKRYMANCNLHGIRYIVGDGLHWTERLFWLITCALCWYGCAIMVENSIESFQKQAIAITGETTYLDWQTNFPSISICMRPHPEALNNARSIYKKKFGSDIRATDWSWIFSGILLKSYPPSSVAKFSQLTTDDITDIYEQSTLKCSELMSECFWRSVKFNCCEEFLPLKTAAGLCYVFNSRHTKNNPSSNEFIVNQDTGVGYLSVGLTSLSFRRNVLQISASIHNDLGIIATSQDGKDIDAAPNKVNTVYIKLENIFNENTLKHVSPVKRGCRFPEETENFNAYKLYSYNGCIIQLLMENMMRICGCVSHLFPHGPLYRVCNYTSLPCLNKNNLLNPREEDSGYRCLPDCEDSVMRHFQNIETQQNNSSQFEISQGIQLRLLALPTSRFKRYVVRSSLDLVVAVGSMAGLFMGAGILSLVEIPYWLLLRNES